MLYSVEILFKKIWENIKLSPQIIEMYVFPDLMQIWPILNKPEITFIDKIEWLSILRTVGVTTGALAGGLESRTLIRLNLFRRTE